MGPSSQPLLFPTMPSVTLMRAGLLSLLLLWSTPSPVSGECPPPDELPVLAGEKNDTFLCARVYTGIPGDDAFSSCNGCPDHDEYLDVLEGEDLVAPSGSYYPAGSAIVVEGCTLYGFQDYDFAVGDPRELPGENVFANVTDTTVAAGEQCAGGFPAFKCRCQQQMPSCVPLDDWVEVLHCDATQATTTVSCTYSEAVGTTFLGEIAYQKSVSTTVGATIEVGFFDLFGAELGVSSTTGYDWEKVSSAAREQRATRTIYLPVDPGVTTVVRQAVGSCSGSTVETELFQFQNVSDAKGDAMWYERRDDWSKRNNV